MDEICFIITCTETYGSLKNIPAADVFFYLEKSGLLALLLETRQSFPDMDIHFYLGMLDGLFLLESDAPASAVPPTQEAISAICTHIASEKSAACCSSVDACHHYYAQQKA